jgi:hypothetical protein
VVTTFCNAGFCFACWSWPLTLSRSENGLSITQQLPAFARSALLSRIDMPDSAITCCTPGMARAIFCTCSSDALVRPSDAPCGNCTAAIT